MSKRTLILLSLCWFLTVASTANATDYQSELLTVLPHTNILFQEKPELVGVLNAFMEQLPASYNKHEALIKAGDILWNYGLLADQTVVQRELDAQVLRYPSRFMRTSEVRRSSGKKYRVMQADGASSVSTLLEDFQVNENGGSCMQTSAAVASSGNGSYIVVWVDYRNVNTDIYARIYNSSGEPISNELLINELTDGSTKLNPVVGMDANGNFVVAWEQRAAASGTILVRRFSAAGIAQTSVIDAGLVGDQTAIAMAPDGRFTVVWQSENSDIYAQLFLASGDVNGSPLLVNAGATDGTQSYPDIAMDDTGNFTITWQGNGIFAKRYNSNGVATSEIITVSTNSGANAAIAVDSDNNFVVAWTQNEAVNARWYSLLNVPSNAFVVHEHTDESYMNPTIASLDVAIRSDDSIDFVWNYTVNLRSYYNSKIYKECTDANGSAVSSLTVKDVDYELTKPRIISLNNSRFIVWQDAQKTKFDNDIIMKGYDFNDSIILNDTRVNNDSGTSYQTQPAINAYYNTEFIAGWLDYRDGENGFYAAQNNVFQGKNSADSKLVFNNTDWFTSRLFSLMDFTFHSDRQGMSSLLYAIYESSGGAASWHILGYSEYNQSQNLTSDTQVSKWVNTSNMALNGADFAYQSDGSAVKCYIEQNPYTGTSTTKLYIDGIPEFPLSDNYHTNPKIAIAPNNLRFVTWEASDGSIQMIMANENSFIGSQITVNDDNVSSNNQKVKPEITSGGSRVIVTWQDTRTGNADTYAQIFTSDGTNIGANFKVNDDGGTDDQYAPVIAVNSTGDFIIAWEDYRNGNADIYAQRYYADGTPFGNNYRVNNDAGTTRQLAPAMDVYQDRVYFTWQDNRIANQGWDVFARVESFPALGASPVLSVDAGGLDFGAYSITLTFTIHNTGGRSLDWNISETSPWISLVSPTFGSNDATITVNIDRAGLSAGNYSDVLAITSNGGSVDLPVSMQVIPISVYFTDNFEDGNANGWKPLTSDRWAIVPDGGYHSYCLQASGFEGDEYSIVDGMSFKDFELYVQVKTMEDLNANPGATVAILFGLQNSANQYYLKLCAWSPENKLYRIVNGQVDVIATYPGTTIADNIYHDVRVIKRNGTIRVYYDTAEIMNVSDNAITIGQIALGSYQSSVCFDDITITGEQISTPEITGAVTGKLRQPLAYQASGAVSDLQHPLEYQFDWGDGNVSSWGAAEQAHAFAVTGTFSVRVKARCQTDNIILSAWSSPVDVNISACQLTVNVTPADKATIGADPDQTEFSYNDQVILFVIPVAEYQFSHWEGDLTGDDMPGTLIMNADKNVTAVILPIPEIISTPAAPTGPDSAKVGMHISFTTEGAISNLAHPPEYQFDWGNNSLSAWSTPQQSIAYADAGTFSVKARARCQTHPDKISEWSETATVHISFCQLSTTVVPGDAGTIIITPDKSSFAYLDTVTVAANPYPGYELEGWSGDVSGSDSSYSLIMDSDKSVIINYTRIKRDPVHFTFKSIDENYPVIIQAIESLIIEMEPGDEIGVFTPGGLCVGASVFTGLLPLSVVAYQDDPQTDDIDGYISGEPMLFRVWDASNGDETEFAAIPHYNLGDGTFGFQTYSIISNLEVIGFTQLKLVFNPGWSWLSMNIQSVLPNVEHMFANTTHLGILIDGAGNFYAPGLMNSIGEWDVKNGYKIYVYAKDSIMVTGSQIPAYTPIELNERWNFISYLPNQPMAPESAFSSIVDNLEIVKNDNGQFYIPGLLSSMDEMMPLEGYKLYMTAAKTFSYPADMTLSKGGHYDVRNTSAGGHFTHPVRTGDNYVIVVDAIQMNNASFDQGDEIGVFTAEGRCVGSSVYDGQTPIAIVAWADDNKTEAVDGFSEGDVMHFRIWDANTNSESEAAAAYTKGDGQFGNLSYARISTLSSTTTDVAGVSGALPTEFALHQNYPNPFNPETQIRFEMPREESASLCIYNMHGQLVETLVNGRLNAGSYSITWQAQNHTSGIYLCHFQAGDYEQSIKLMLVK
ncbi:T9SS type A sorting domain-containing protein [candidate division KSB1 bacterium]|nr:T9SS type A sorting domain-containing protein [candidate division KSB1 bacterium]